MSRIIEKVINRFDGGVNSRIRGVSDRFAQSIQHFDIISDPNKLQPYRNMETDGAGDIEQLGKITLGADGIQYALGVKGGGPILPQIWERTVPDGAWGKSTTAFGSVSTTTYKFLIDYHGILYGSSAANIFSYAYGTDTFQDTALGVIPTGQGIVHSKDDCLYVPAGTSIYRKNNSDGSAYNTGWNGNLAVITLPTTVQSICEYGDFLAIACAPTQNNSSSIVYLWDRDTSLTTLTKKIDWGTGVIQKIAVVNGYLIGISTTTITTTTLKAKTRFRYLLNDQAEQFLELESRASTTNVVGGQIVNNRFLFMMSITLNSVLYVGVWSIGKTTDGFALSLEYLLNNNSGFSGAVALLDFQLNGDYMTVFFEDGSTFYSFRTNNDATFTASSIYESVIINLGDSGKQKKLVGATLMFEPLSGTGDDNGVVKLLYKRDADTGWTRIFTFGASGTDSLDFSLSKDAVNCESSSDTITMSIASPCVVTLSGHDLGDGQAVSFTTTYALPTGIVAGTVYYVRSSTRNSSGLTTSTFHLYDTYEHAVDLSSVTGRVVTTDSQSGVHTMTRQSINLPQFKELQFRVESVGNAIITGLGYKVEETVKQPY